MLPPVNIYTPDRESDITAYGRHNRLLVFGSTDGRTGCAEDQCAL